MNKVSIIVAAFNIEDYIGRCLDSLINQTYSNIEKDEMEFFIFKQGFDFYKDIMFFQDSVGKQMYLNWRSLNINIFKNKYFKNNASLKSKLANVAYQLNYDIAKISYRSLITCRKVMNKEDIL